MFFKLPFLIFADMLVWYSDIFSGSQADYDVGNSFLSNFSKISFWLLGRFRSPEDRTVTMGGGMASFGAVHKLRN